MPRKSFNSRRSNNSNSARPFQKKRKGSSFWGSSDKKRSFGGRRRRPRKSQSALNISSFINKAPTNAKEEPLFVPKHTFPDFAIHEKLKIAIAERGYITPTPIQDSIIPEILNGKDVFGLANTGTGKTAAFLIPLVHKILQNPNEQVLILSPTRELALQIDQEFRSLTNKLRLFSVSCVGGAHIGRQIKRLRMKNHCIIGTPGRVIDLIKRGNLNLSNTNTVVLDEADRMLDMGFINDVTYIMKKAPLERHTLCFSATASPKISQLIKEFLKDPITVSVKKQDVAKNIEQDVVRIKGRDKIDVLVELLEQEGFDKVIVFGRTKHGVRKLSDVLRKRGIRNESIHGDKSHTQRQRALKKFKDGLSKTLIGTDVASRGLDISGVTHVINYDLPESYDDYVHRIGRTGRGDSRGKALTFVN